ncbi:hypothetical protein SteCoe_18630 [Stentor coeruleus]|uniref:1-phosphatidylinositol-3-phosphate 5-kinase n=1 Tax=Stentor coeruleus TaxID=5963 RepID=A0A1R2BWP5_9CILI|nr:hypothetical protein SteCoe_18630 [Stentor coeruleus]
MNRAFSPINRQYWIPDSETKSCNDCGLNFTAFRRRHHCRFCGMIFCKKHVSSKKTNLSQKILNMICDKCIEAINKCEAKQAQRSPTSLCSSPSFFQGNTSNTFPIKNIPPKQPRIYTKCENPLIEIERMQSIINTEDEITENLFNNYLLNRTKILVSSLGIQEEWNDILVVLVNNVVKSICPSVQYRGDSLDITKCIRIQKIICEDTSNVGFTNGLVFPKNLVNKKMCKTLDSPKILMLKSFSIIEHGSMSMISMEKLIEQEESRKLMVLKKIQDLTPNIVMCEKSLPQDIIDSLTKFKIAAIALVKPKILKLLSRATSGKILENPNEMFIEKNFLGTCINFYSESRGDTNFLHFEGFKDRSTIGTIFISGPKETELDWVKKSLKSLMKEYRNIRIEKSFIEDFKILGIEDFYTQMQETSIVFKQFIISENNPCKDPKICSGEFYSVEDSALGEFLIKTIEKIDSKCKVCNLSWGNHNYYYIRKEGRIKICIHRENFQQNTKDSSSTNIYVNRECKYCSRFEKYKNPLSSTMWEYSFYKFINNFFIKSSMISSAINCKHNFFNSSRFHFYIKDSAITIEYENNPCYKVLSINNRPDNTTVIKKKIENIVDKIKNYGVKIIEELIQTSKELLLNANNDVAEEEKEESEWFWQSLKNQLSLITENLSLELVKLYDLSPLKFSNVLEVETFRRSLFFKICDAKLIVSNILSILKVFLRKEKTSFNNTINETFTVENKNMRGVVDEDEFWRRRSLTIFGSKCPEKGTKIYETLNSKDFKALKRGNLTLETGKNNLFIPVEEDDCMSIIAYTLNSKQYYEEILKDLENLKEMHMIESELLNCTEKHFQFQFSTYSSEQVKELIRNEDIIGIYGDLITFNVHIFYPRQFHVIRERVADNHANFIQSIYQSENKNEQLGKSKATFSKSFDERYIIKVLDEKEFTMFKDLAPNYFRHFCNESFHNMPSKMVKTLGCFRVFSKNHTTGRTKIEWVLLLENLGCIMPKDIQVYDLKGSFNHRRYVEIGERRTKMDKNYMEDFGGLPLTIPKEAREILDMSIFNDSLFLYKQNIVDYSLLLMISAKEKVITYGIIDYIAKFTLEKAIERKYKKISGTNDPTIAKPLAYKTRFRTNIMKMFFLEADN